MDNHCIPGYNFGSSRSYEKQVFQFQLPKAYLPNFERIASTQTPPYDPRALTESDPDPPVRDCAAWVAEVLEKIRVVLQSAGVAL